MNEPFRIQLSRADTGGKFPHFTAVYQSVGYTEPLNHTDLTACPLVTKWKDWRSPPCPKLLAVATPPASSPGGTPGAGHHPESRSSVGRERARLNFERFLGVDLNSNMNTKINLAAGGVMTVWVYAYISIAVVQMRSSAPRVFSPRGDMQHSRPLSKPPPPCSPPGILWLCLPPQGDL